MSALPGTIDEWVEIAPLRWQRKDDPAGDIVTLREGLSFKDYFARRAEPEPPPPPRRDLAAELDALRAEHEALKSEVRAKVTRVDGPAALR